MPMHAKHAPPPVQLRWLLMEARERGEDFDTAWRRALDGRRQRGRVVFGHDTMVRRQWRMILTGQRRHWRAAYERRGARALRALDELVAPDDSPAVIFPDSSRVARAPMPYVITPEDHAERRATAAP